ncbi:MULTISPECIES: hypothetical protein [unclassified Cellulomonas]|uniref:hypothetical protein n=1 Tax=unclassified Cellulomonas TaxID=2620175 RepID=UPI0024B7B662|nr:hypothetical protein [Cellulomonas sp. ES6]WHP16403.1 hypothetical protein P9841_12315 [Cellulomonas sp. ES6]
MPRHPRPARTPARQPRPPAPRPGLRRPRRRTVVLGAVVAGLLVVLVGADLATRWWAEGRAADRLGTELADRGLRDVGVHLDGVLVLPQLLGGDLDGVVVSAVVPFEALDASGLSQGSDGSGTEGQGDGEDGGRTPPAGGSGAAGSLDGLSWSGEDGLLVARGELTRRSLSLPVAVASEVAAADGDLVLTPRTVTVSGVTLPVDRAAGLLPGGLADLLAPRRVDVGALVPERFDGAELRSASVTEQGVAVSVAVPGDVLPGPGAAASAP